MVYMADLGVLECRDVRISVLLIIINIASQHGFQGLVESIYQPIDL